MDKQYIRLNITLPIGLYKDFETYCKAEGMKLSSRIAILIKEELNDRLNKKQ